MWCPTQEGDDRPQTSIRRRLMRKGDFLVSQAEVAGRRWLRLTIMNPLTDEATVDRLLDRIGELAGEASA